MIAYSPFGSPDLPWGEKLPHILVDPTLKEIAAKYERSTAQIVLRWLLQRNLVTIPKVMKKFIFLHFLSFLFFTECHWTRIIGQFESLRIWIDRGWNAKDFRIEQKSEENCSSQQIEGWIRCFARWKKSSFSISLRRKNVNKNWNSDSLFSKGKNAWNIHKFMGHKRESQSWRKKWIKKFSKKKNPISNFYFSPCRKSFPICINYHYIAMTSSNITYESRMEVCTPISHVLTFTS